MNKYRIFNNENGNWFIEQEARLVLLGLVLWSGWRKVPLMFNCKESAVAFVRRAATPTIEVVERKFVNVQPDDLNAR